MKTLENECESEFWCSGSSSGSKSVNVRVTASWGVNMSVTELKGDCELEYKCKCDWELVCKYECELECMSIKM